MAYRAVFRRSAARDLDGLARPIHNRVWRAITALAVDPRPRGAKLLAGPERIWRIRVGDYRILYVVDDTLTKLVILRILHRSKAYR